MLNKAYRPVAMASAAAEHVYVLAFGHAAAHEDLDCWPAAVQSCFNTLLDDDAAYLKTTLH